MSITVELEVGSVKATIAGLDAQQALIATSKAMPEAGRFLMSEIRRNMGLTDHSLSDLARMDHPYARRHGRIRIHESRPWLVHRQSGQLLSALRDKVVPGKYGATYKVWIDNRVAPYSDYVIRGTRWMLPRDVLWSTATDKRVEKEILKVFVRVLCKEMRSKANVRFTFGRGTGTKI